MAIHRLCSIPNCGKRHYGNGFCAAHNAKNRKYGDPLFKKVASPQEPMAFIEKAIAYDGDDCLIWPFRSSQGYARVRINRKHRNVSSVVCEKVHGPAPSNKHEAAHSCGKGVDGCVSPSHLRWATSLENSADTVAHGHVPRGRDLPGAKLTESDVIAIRRSRGLITQKDLANSFGVSSELICLIQRGKRWAWLPNRS